MANEVWVFVEQKEGKMKKSAAELLINGQKIAENLGQKFAAVVFGNDISEVTEQVKEYGVEKVYLADDEKLKIYNTESFTTVMTDLIQEEEPELVLFGHSALTKDFVPRVAERVGTGLVTDCTDINEDLSFKRPIYAGKAFSTVKFTDQRPVMATIRANALGAGEPVGSKSPDIVDVEVSVDDENIRTLVKDIVQKVTGRPELTEAEIIVSGGRGMKGPDNFALLEDLADVLGAAVGASRAAVDAGWREQEFQVGQTGKTVSPQIYIACGISGAIQHLAGMGSSKYIVAINKDPEANIFKVADYGIVGDLFKLVPLMTQEFKKVLAG